MALKSESRKRTRRTGNGHAGARFDLIGRHARGTWLAIMRAEV
jgi:hypothetical protein